MAMFLYQARTDRGELVTGSLDADSENAVDDALRARGLYVTKIRTEKAKAVKAEKAAEAPKRVKSPTLKPRAERLSRIPRPTRPKSTTKRSVRYFRHTHRMQSGSSAI